jgi:hypothetical protein
MSFSSTVLHNGAATVNGSGGRPSIKTVMTYVTPSMAGDWLANNNDGNRKVRKGDVAVLRRQIEEGKYEPTHQGIGFYEDGTLADGQHRLHAIVEAEVGIWINVTTGLRRTTVHKIDKGIGRTSLDSLHFLGVKSDSRRVAVCQCMIYQLMAERTASDRWDVEKSTSEEFSAYYAKCVDAIEFAMGFSAASKFPAPLKAAVATAWFSQDRQRLTEFMLVLDTGEMFSDDDRAAIRLRDYLRDKKYGQGCSARNDLFMRCCGALRYFIARKGLTKLYATPEHVFQFSAAIGEVG